MKRKIVSTLKLLSTVVLVLLSLSYAQAKTALTLGVVLFPPEVTIDEKTKECVGSAITTTRELLIEYGIKLHVVCAPAQRIIRLIQSKEIDFTISVKSDEILTKHVVYSDIPFRKVKINLYIRNELKQFKTISAVRGFEYQGYREKFSQEGMEFIDLPNSVSAIQFFLKERSEAMISYEAPVQSYMKTNQIVMQDTYTITVLQEANLYYSVAKHSPHLNELLHAFRDYAVKHQAQHYTSAQQHKNNREETTEF